MKVYVVIETDPWDHTYFLKACFSEREAAEKFSEHNINQRVHEITVDEFTGKEDKE